MIFEYISYNLLKKLQRVCMQNPFESGHIKNYILLYASVVVIMILFFIASTLFNDVKKVEKKVFDVEESDRGIQSSTKEMMNVVEVNSSKFKLLDKAY